MEVAVFAVIKEQRATALFPVRQFIAHFPIPDLLAELVGRLAKRRSERVGSLLDACINVAVI